MKSLKKGFTLVELMVVIVIIGILAALAIPRFLGASNKAKATEFKPVLKQIATLEEAYKQERDVYTSNLASIAFDAPSGGTSRFSYEMVGSATTTTWQSNAALKIDIGTIAASSASVSWAHDASAAAGSQETKGSSGTNGPALAALANWN